MDWKTKVKYWWQRQIQGYDDRVKWSLNNFIVEKLHDPIIEFCDYEAEHGKTTPTEFITDPAAWLEILRTIEYAFRETWKEQFQIELNSIPEKGTDKWKERNETIQKGFEYFGKYLMDLWEAHVLA